MIKPFIIIQKNVQVISDAINKTKLELIKRDRFRGVTFTWSEVERRSILRWSLSLTVLAIELKNLSLKKIYGLLLLGAFLLGGSLGLTHTRFEEEREISEVLFLTFGIVLLFLPVLIFYFRYEIARSDLINWIYSLQFESIKLEFPGLEREENRTEILQSILTEITGIERLTFDLAESIVLAKNISRNGWYMPVEQPIFRNILSAKKYLGELKGKASEIVCQ